ncbi:MAG: hypothetical protein AAF291_05970 [Pseudomonadota bacterium]
MGVSSFEWSYVLRKALLARCVFAALKRKEPGLSSNPDPFFGSSRPSHRVWCVFALGLMTSGGLVSAPLAAQDDTAVTPEDTATQTQTDSRNDGEEDEQEPPARINLSVTVPRGEVNVAQAQQCVDEADAGEISGEIVVCRRLGESGENYYSGSAAEARKRYARETAFKGSPATPNVSGLSDNGRGIGIGGVPPPALIIDVGALPPPPPGSDADRIARGLPPLGQDENLTEEEIRQRREALGLPPPSFSKKKGN